MSGLRHVLSCIADRDSEWAGIPMPLNGERLVIDERYPFAKGLMQIGATPAEEENRGKEARIRNSFWSWYRRSDITIWEEGGKVNWGLLPGVNHLRFQLGTLSGSDAWSIESENRALQTLGTLVRHRTFKQYLLTGSFLETSKRSRVTYLFRKLRPTVAMGHRPDGELKILCTLCLHPIAYYAESWAGAMCPTDDVLAHLMLMRGDEKLFWRRANQHAAWRPESGL